MKEHIVELLGGEIELGALFLRRVDARDLGKSEWCNRGGDWRFRGTCADAKRVLQNMASALRYLHDSNLVHNDVKPANILYHRQKGAKLVDFGLATRLGSAASTGGTPWYLPPEFLSRKQRGAPADVFALGIVMAYLLGCIAIPDCGREAKMWLIAQVHGNSGSPAAKAMADWLRIVNEVRRNLQDNNDPAHQLVLRMLTQRPKDRITAWDLDAKISAVRT
ncbi:Calcium/calmodulin-dependent protein kinase type 1 [Colletotrichum kahawae]|uniref:Calcium/calmodulin-dependent protein kinase type 1 n=1 Tax=Colletotrichum kahawae TaxID=34407 RepID=A0AAE0D8P5_COLKA|nr:Calcium/calmodulin-dependent protein kinase type 1 [Colletotrichum kahawae]